MGCAQLLEKYTFLMNLPISEYSFRIYSIGLSIGCGGYTRGAGYPGI
jgi:hypothetical protein